MKSKQPWTPAGATLPLPLSMKPMVGVYRLGSARSVVLHEYAVKRAESR